MKFWWLAILIICTPLLSFAGQSQEKYWFCYQVGSVKKASTFAISNIFIDDYPYNYEERQTQFEKEVKRITNGAFRAEFGATCLYEDDAKKATKQRQRKINSANDRGYKIWPVQFVYDPKE